MNTIINTQLNHRSYRSYTSKKVEPEKLDAVIKASQAAPSWINGQQVSIIAVFDDQRKKRLSELVGNQAYVAEVPVFLIFCADFYRAQLAGEVHGKTLEAIDDVDALLVGATDVGLAMSNAITAAESLDLGTVPIGGIRKNPLEVIELLELPKHVIPIAGLCVGYPSEDPGLKPRLPKEAIYHEESYQTNVAALIESYDQSMRAYMHKRTNGAQSTSWTERVSSFYEKPYYTSIAQMLEKQGFTCKNIKE
ncbi:NADPH-dependent oxidoreductase [Alkalihalophilus marmarensis]|uniref:NADPH-dependent oxidoreductase n=1 Tax=Alkalihalophilus marmarensis TaxID=521377 RepID=UPI002DBA55D7|nr:NADPH-dependent oxidoreductase [Alkalihalophilus marmarensis]MEC2071540.1 NADPH-dependent oxidoreductase [Alkalihalophilus marmarensis]